MKLLKYLIFNIFIIIFINNLPIAYAYTDGMEISVAPKAVNFHIVDPMGRISGYTPTIMLKQIPFMGYYIEGGLDAPEPITDPLLEWHVIREAGSGQQVINGKYKLVLFGINVSTITQFGISISWNDSTQWVMRTGKKMTIWPNAVWTYEFDVPVTPTGTQIVLTKIASSNDLIADINSANQAGYFTTPGTYQSLLAKAQDAQAKLVAGQTIPAKNILNAFINDINAQKGKQINTIAADILIEDAQYIINHI